LIAVFFDCEQCSPNFKPYLIGRHIPKPVAKNQEGFWGDFFELLFLLNQADRKRKSKSSLAGKEDEKEAHPFPLQGGDTLSKVSL
jgi:hypothetical protein